ncbi:hypothetical protein BJ546DRAFT_1015094, partial [Cryomyces antarcticus]
MKVTPLISLGFMLSATTASYQCPITMPSDASAIKFAYSIQNLLYNYYKSVPVNTTFFDKLPMGTTTSHLDNMTMSANVVTNLQGLQNQAMLGVQALSDFGSMASSWVVPSCTYTYPPVTNASSHIVNAYYIEASLCGAFIGLADYVQTPTAAFLMARLAAEHGIHASFLGSYMNAAPFSATNTMLTPAFTPESLLRVGSEVGMLGSYLGSCVPAPSAPCNGTVVIGDLNAMLVSAGATAPTIIGTGRISKTVSGVPSMTSSLAPQQFTGGAEKKGFNPLAGSFAFAAML